MNKRGQIFLIAALVIVAIMVGLATTHNRARDTKEDTIVYDLSKEINFEEARVIDSGVFNSLDDFTYTYEYVEQLTDFYAESTQQSDFLAIFGNERTLKVIFYKKTVTGLVALSLGGSQIEYETTEEFKTEDSVDRPDDGNIQVILDEETEYNFHLRPGHVFFIILKKEKQGERFIALPKTSE